MRDLILSAIETLKKDRSSQCWVRPIGGTPSPDQHQFVLFLKPEVLMTGVRFDLVLDLVLNSLAKWNVNVGAVRILSGGYLKAHNLMGRHYGVINRISREGRRALTAEAEQKLVELFQDPLRMGAPVLGGHEFLAQRPDFSPASICTVSDNVGATKLGGGSYALSIKVVGKPYLVLNAFHPQQLEPYYGPDAVLPVFECTSKTPWKDLRQKMTGATNPLKADPASIRGQLLARQQELGMEDVSQGANGIHLSAGPLEGMVELTRFFSDEESGRKLESSGTAFGTLLANEGLSAKTIESFADNPSALLDGKPVTSFDMTEEMDALPAAGKLAKAFAGQAKK